MKKFFLILMLVPLISSYSHAQKIVEDKIDEFTNTSVKRTSQEVLFRAFTEGFGYCIARINQSTFMEVYFSMGRVFAIDEGAELMFKLSDGSVVTLFNSKYDLSNLYSMGGSSYYYVRLTFPLRETEIKALKSTPISKLRIYTTDGYFERDVKEKAAKKFIKCLSLVE